MEKDGGRKEGVELDGRFGSFRQLLMSMPRVSMNEEVSLDRPDEAYVRYRFFGA
jgi:hypothetical protein